MVTANTANLSPAVALVNPMKESGNVCEGPELFQVNVRRRMATETKHMRNSFERRFWVVVIAMCVAPPKGQSAAFFAAYHRS